MMDWTNLVTQLPVVAAFIWFAMRTQERYQESMDKRDSRYLAILDKLSEKIDCHDQRVDERINKLVSSVKPGSRKGSTTA